MIEVKWNTKKVNSLYKKFDKIINFLPKAVERGVKISLTDMQRLALEKKRGNKNVEMIPFSIKVEENVIHGRLYTDKQTFSYASFLEYGTGTYAEREHIGTTKTFISSNYTYWYLPVEKADRDFGSERLITIGENQYYIMYPQKPSPFMRPTGFESRDKNVDNVSEAIFKMLKEVL